jgi:hypothetical protein
MKTIPVEQLEHRLSEALKQQDEHEAIGLTTSAGTVALVVKVPESLKHLDADLVVVRAASEGQVLFVVETKGTDEKRPAEAGNVPAVGAGRGTLTILKEDDEHLKDFREYME